MRQVINISLPKGLLSGVDDIVEEENFTTRSEFFRHLIRMKMEKKMSGELEKSRKELEAGGDTELKSLADLE